jgi:hypothetical protein
MVVQQQPAFVHRANIETAASPARLQRPRSVTGDGRNDLDDIRMDGVSRNIKAPASMARSMTSRK